MDVGPCIHIIVHDETHGSKRNGWSHARKIPSWSHGFRSTMVFHKLSGPNQARLEESEDSQMWTPENQPKSTYYKADSFSSETWFLKLKNKTFWF